MLIHRFVSLMAIGVSPDALFSLMSEDFLIAIALQVSVFLIRCFAILYAFLSIPCLSPVSLALLLSFFQTVVFVELFILT